MKDEESNEIERIYVENKVARFSGNSMSLTIAPTMACNFRCPYCYEQGKECITMNAETVKKLKEFIGGLKEKYNRIGITWYGGEPLLAMDIIEEVMSELYQHYDREHVTVSAVTNGYLLTEDVVEKLKKWDIKGLQITIDGPPEIHNKRRRLPSGEDTFFVILNNMKKALEIFPELNIVVRINVDKTNIHGVDGIVSYLKEYTLLEKIQLYLAPVTDINGSCAHTPCFQTREFAIEEYEFMKRHQETGISFINLPKKILECVEQWQLILGLLMPEEICTNVGMMSEKFQKKQEVFLKNLP